MGRKSGAYVHLQATDKSCANTTRTRNKSVRRYFAQIKKDMRTIRRIRSRIGICPDEYARKIISDFYVLAEKNYVHCRNARIKGSTMPFCGNVPRVCNAFESFILHSDTALEVDSFRRIIKIPDSEYPLSVTELFLMRELVFGAVLSVCVRVLGDYADTSDIAVKDTCIKKLTSLVDSMRFVSVHGFEKDILSCRVSLILNGDPSGDYQKMTVKSKLMYLERLQRLSEKEKLSEAELAARLVSEAHLAKDKRDRHIGKELMKTPKSKLYPYFIFSAALPIVLTIILGLLSPMLFIVLFPLWEFFSAICNFAFSRFASKMSLPFMDIDEIPDNSPVLVVLTAVLQGEEKDQAMFDRLERIYNANCGKNIKFGVLADLCDSKTATVHDDERILEYAYGRIQALCAKYGDDFVLLERARSYSKSEEMFIGSNGRYGAICELVSFLKGKDNAFSERSKSHAMRVISGSVIKYVITLNAGNEPGLWAVRDMCAAMLHPLAVPYIDDEKCIVTKGYGMISIGNGSEIPKKAATYFSRIMCGRENVPFDAYTKISGKGVFCGEGIFDVDAFYEVMIKHSTFPDDSILNHDILTGMKLRCARLTEIQHSESSPCDQLSYMRHFHKRICGDVRNLAYIFPHIRLCKKDKRINGIDGFSRFVLFDVIRSAITPVFAMSGVFLSVFADGYVRGLMLSVSLLYLAVQLLCSPLSLSEKFASLAFSVSMLPMSAFCAADAFVKGLYRSLVSKKKLLEKQTYKQEASCGMLVYVYRNIFCVFSGFLLFVISPVGIFQIISMLWFAFPVIAYHASSCTGCEKEAAVFFEKSVPHAAKLHHFFCSTVTKANNHLPPSDICFNLTENSAHTTSPTSIGLYLLSLLCARDNGFITTKELESRILETITTLERLPKFNGLFYSSYDTKTLEALPPFYVSSSVNASLNACLTALANGLTEYVNESTSILNLTKRITAAGNAMSFSFLYNSSCDLFSQGAWIKSEKATPDTRCCDTPSSEALTLAYIQYASRTVPPEHWDKLLQYVDEESDKKTKPRNYLPHMFLPIRKTSLLYDAPGYCLKDNGIHETFLRAFGNSMSIRFMTDERMRCASKVLSQDKL